MRNRHKHREHENERYERIEYMLKKIDRKVTQMAASQADLDAAVSALVTEVQAAVDAIVAKSNVDLSAEVDQLNKATADLQAAVAPANPPTPAPPAPAPGV